MHENVETSEGVEKLFGKFRGTVVDNLDPLGIGRIQATVPAVSDQPLSWAMPCVPYAGQGVGFHAIPPIGANVWVEFEAGDPSFPIWVGGFWGEATEKPNQATGSEKKVWQTEKMSLVLDDAEGALTATIGTGNDRNRIEMNDSEISINSRLMKIIISQSNIQLRTPIASFNLDMQGVRMQRLGGGTITIDDAISLKNGVASAEINPVVIQLKAGESSILINPVGVDITEPDV